MPANRTELFNCSIPQPSIADYVDMWVMGVGVTIIALIGTGANVCNIVVFAHKRMRRQSINVFFISISAADIAVLMSSVLVFSLPAFGNWMTGCQSVKNAVVHVQRWSYPLALISQTASVWLTVSVALFRYVAICMPLYGQRYCRLSNAQRLVIGVVVSSAFYNLPRFFEFEIVTKLKCRADNVSVAVVVMKVTSMRLQDNYSYIYITILYNLLMFIIPFALLAFVNVRAMAAVRRSCALRRLHLKNLKSTVTKDDQRHLSRTQINTTVMLICIVFVFLACNLPIFVTNLVEMILGSAAPAMTSPTYLNFVNASNLLVAFNSSANIIIYISLSKQYRKLLMYIVCRRGPPPKGWLALGYLPMPAVAGTNTNNNANTTHRGGQPFVHFTHVSAKFADSITED